MTRHSASLRRSLYLLVIAAVLSLGAGSPRAASRAVILATATSVQDTGLLDRLVLSFERRTGYTLKAIAVGTGQALAMGARGEADVVLSHSPELELKYLAEGSVTNRRLVMYNDFVLVGPPSDPAGIKGMRSASEALRRIAERYGRFVSRADHSGTHEKELALWKAVGRTPRGKWYLESGQGQAATLILASEKAAYALTDRGTYLSFPRRGQLVILLEGDPRLLNVYHVMEVNPARYPKANAEGGRAFADFLVSSVAQAIVKTFGVEKYGQPLFVPAAGQPEAR